MIIYDESGFSSGIGIETRYCPYSAVQIICNLENPPCRACLLERLSN
jgi:hypothetical protein